MSTQNISSLCQRVKWINGENHEYTSIELFVPAKNQKSTKGINTIVYFPSMGIYSWFPTQQSVIERASNADDYLYVLNNCYVLTIAHHSTKTDERRMGERISETIYQVISDNIQEKFDASRVFYIGFSLGAAKLTNMLINPKFTNTFRNMILGYPFLCTVPQQQWGEDVKEMLEKYREQGRNRCNVWIGCDIDDEGIREFDKVCTALDMCVKKMNYFTTEKYNRGSFKNALLYGTEKFPTSISERFIENEESFEI